jgi:hypothetical protein
VVQPLESQAFLTAVGSNVGDGVGKPVGDAVGSWTAKPRHRNRLIAPHSSAPLHPSAMLWGTPSGWPWAPRWSRWGQESVLTWGPPSDSAERIRPHKLEE